MSGDSTQQDLEDEINHLEAKLDEARSKLKEKRLQKDDEATVSVSHSLSSIHQLDGLSNLCYLYNYLHNAN